MKTILSLAVILLISFGVVGCSDAEGEDVPVSDARAQYEEAIVDSIKGAIWYLDDSRTFSQALDYSPYCTSTKWHYSPTHDGRDGVRFYCVLPETHGRANHTKVNGEIVDIETFGELEYFWYEAYFIIGADGYIRVAGVWEVQDRTNAEIMIPLKNPYSSETPGDQHLRALSGNLRSHLDRYYSRSEIILKDTAANWEEVADVSN